MKPKKSHHHLTLVQSNPTEGLGEVQPVQRAMPVEKIYSLRTDERSISPNKNIQETPKPSRRSMFFTKREPDIESDPFLRRLSQLK